MQYIGGRFHWMKITREASDTAENLQLYRVVWFFHPEIVMHDRYIGRHSKNNIKCIVNDDLGGRTEQLDIIAGFLPHHWLYE